MKFACFSCRKELDGADKVGRQETCPFCQADLHCCKQCQFYDSASYNECREPQAERVLEKNRANFCDYFSVNANPHGAAKQDDAKQKLDELFKK